MATSAVRPVVGSGMDRRLIFDHLAIALRRVTEGEYLIAQQREIIAALERNGLDNSEAKASAPPIRGAQGMLIADRDRLKEETGQKFKVKPTLRVKVKI
jgi:hypothetical protein